MSFGRFMDKVALALVTLAIPVTAGLVTAVGAYDAALEHAIGEDFIEATGEVLDDDGIRSYEKTTEEGKELFIAEVVAKNGTVYELVWDATGHEYRDGFYSDKDAAEIVKAEDPISVERYNGGQEM